MPQYSCLENSEDRGAWWAIVHGIAKSWTRLCDFHKGHVVFHALKQTTGNSWKPISQILFPDDLPSRIQQVRLSCKGHASNALGRETAGSRFRNGTCENHLAGDFPGGPVV